MARLPSWPRPGNKTYTIRKKRGSRSCSLIFTQDTCDTKSLHGALSKPWLKLILQWVPQNVHYCCCCFKCVVIISSPPPWACLFLAPWKTHLLTAESVRMVAIGDLMFRMSHTRTVRSSLPETTLSPLANTADVTGLGKWKQRTWHDTERQNASLFISRSKHPFGHQTGNKNRHTQ